MLKLLTLNKCNADTLRQRLRDDKWQHLPKRGLSRMREKMRWERNDWRNGGGEEGEKNNEKKEEKKDWKRKKRQGNRKLKRFRSIMSERHR